MKNLYVIIFLLFTFLFVSSCSTMITDIPKSKIEYVKSAIVCDAKSSDFKILNESELANFLDSDEFGNIDISYQSGRLKRKVRISKVNINDSVYYIAKFERKTFPFSSCRKIKTETRHFK